MREAGPQDHAVLLAFLQAHEASSMFAMVNLQGLGVPMRVWVEGDPVAGMVGVTGDGMVLVQWPGGDWGAVARALCGVAVTGLMGPADQVAAVRGVLDLGAARHADEEPGFRLALDDLRLPDCAGYDLRPIATDVLETVLRWRVAYEGEVFSVPAPEAAQKAARDVARWLAADSHRVLWQRGEPVGLTGFNAVLPEVVQIGAVYVPPGQRGRGHARRAVGLHLAEARAGGVRRAVLFAASEAAERVYRALGFVAAGRMGIVLYGGPRVVA